jgi:hypothetical protein
MERSRISSTCPVPPALAGWFGIPVESTN